MIANDGHPATLPKAWDRIDQLEREKTGTKIDWPDMAEDVSVPLSAMLRDLNLLELADDKTTWLRTPFSKQAITSGVIAATKITAPSVGFVGLLGSIGIYLKGFSATGPADWVLLGCATVLLTVTAVAVAILIKADLTARATASAAQYRARAFAADVYLRTVRPMDHKPAGPEAKPTAGR